MKPLKITFEVAGGWVPPPYPLHLDAVLAYAETFNALRDIEDNPSVEALRALSDHLPLAKHEQEGEWVWKASAIMPEGPVMNDSRFYTQRRDKVDYACRIRDGSVMHGRHMSGKVMTPYQFQIDTARGVQRNLLGFYPVQQAFSTEASANSNMKLVAWCVGNRDVIEELLSPSYGRVTHLGARRRSGHGKIVSVSVADDEAGQEYWKLRVRPWRMLDDDAPLEAACRAPYWAAENRGSMFCPLRIG